ncbi:GAF domain-containing sensor histidine kinase [Nocardioides KLBMP 9356]|uniref:Sensor-like histidine kinase SenX3 n=1 Tax=Nocardioides potassii TaxID=2911371 RepID=A0ABS9H6P2_9ACTN|nr:GAF domain-containing sensor histidine kinase [Nocardioides potassii]MCF6376119.1 GAF domain-containing sensor histidine kinase [Nocardioides potassii]
MARTLDDEPQGAVSFADEQTRQHLQVLVESVATLAGFEQSAITLRRSHDFLILVAAGVADGFAGTRVPVEAMEEEMSRADDWGVWRFVPHERVSDEVLPYSHIPDVVPLDVEDAWHPLDMLFAPLHDDDGVLRGMLSVDSPRNGRKPGPEQMKVLTQYAGVARTLVLLALERESLAERVRITDEARAIVRQALGEPSLELVLEACRSAVVDCFQAAGMWLTAFHEDGVHATTSYAVGSDTRPPFEEIDDVVIGLAHRYWDDQYVAHFSPAHPSQPGLPEPDAERLLAFLERIGIASVLFVPLGAGPECLGFLVLTRVSGTPEWTAVERDAALEIGRDLGRAVANTRQLARERAVADHLRQIDGYRIEMVNTLAHELRTPLFSMTANLELLDVDSLEPEDQRSVAAASRGAERMRVVIEDLLTMARIADPQREFVPEQVDLRQVLLDVTEECHHAAAAKSQECRIDTPDEPVHVAGNPQELHRMLANLASNAIKYSPRGAGIDVRLARVDGLVRVSITDPGIGISERDRDHLFREFFRSTNPQALSVPGTGMGLAIVDRIVRRHSGHVDVVSELGEGTTVSVTLPSLDPSLDPSLETDVSEVSGSKRS